MQSNVGGVVAEEGEDDSDGIWLSDHEQEDPEREEQEYEPLGMILKHASRAPWTAGVPLDSLQRTDPLDYYKNFAAERLDNRWKIEWEEKMRKQMEEERRKQEEKEAKEAEREEKRLTRLEETEARRREHRRLREQEAAARRATRQRELEEQRAARAAEREAARGARGGARGRGGRGRGRGGRASSAVVGRGSGSEEDDEEAEEVPTEECVPPAWDGEPEGINENVCSICRDRAKCTANIPCGHQAYCVFCARAFRGAIATGRHICPICRVTVQKVIRVFDG